MKNMLLSRFSLLKCWTKVPCEYKSVHGCSEELKLISTKINSQKPVKVIDVKQKDDDVGGSNKDSGVQKNVETGDVTVGDLRHDAYTEKTVNVMRPGNGEENSKDVSSSECFADQQSKASVEVQPISFVVMSNVLQGIIINEQKAGPGHGVDRKRSFNTLEYWKELDCTTKLDDAKDEQSWQQFHLKTNNTDLHVGKILMVYFDNAQFRELWRALTVNNKGCVERLLHEPPSINGKAQDLSFDPGGKWLKEQSVEGIYQSGVVSMGKQGSWSLYGECIYSYVKPAMTYGVEVDHGLCLNIQLCSPSDCLKHFVMEVSSKSCEYSPGTGEVVSELRFQNTCEICYFHDPNLKDLAASMLIGKLKHGECECAPSAYFILKFVSFLFFLFDPGGVVCPIGAWRTCSRIIIGISTGISTETIIFRIFFVDLRCCDWSFDMVCGYLIMFPLRHNDIVWAFYCVSTFKQQKWGMNIATTCMETLYAQPSRSVLFFVTIITRKCAFMGLQDYKSSWEVLLRWAVPILGALRELFKRLMGILWSFTVMLSVLVSPVGKKTKIDRELSGFMAILSTMPKGVWRVLLRWTRIFTEAFCDPFGILTSILWLFTITVSLVVAILSSLMLVSLRCCIIEDAGKLCYRSGVKVSIYTTLIVDYLFKYGNYLPGVRNILDIGFMTARNYSLLWEHTCWYKSLSNKTQLCSYDKEMRSLCVPAFEVKYFVLGMSTKQLGVGLLWGRKFNDVALDPHKSLVSRIGELLKIWHSTTQRLAANKEIDYVGFSIYSTFEREAQGEDRNGESYIFIPYGYQDQKSYITRGRVILREGWNDVNNINMEMKFMMVEISGVIIDPCGNTWCKSGQSREFLKLFHNVVNGLDPPMGLDDATAEHEQLEDEFCFGERWS